MALVYIAGYITRNDNQPSEYETHFYYEKYGKYTNLIDRGKQKFLLTTLANGYFLVSSFSIK